jgi:hypothetical protein
MAATFNLVRNSRVFFTTNVDPSTGVVAATGFTTTNTQELQVLDGFTFGQTSTADTITISEAGSTPTRGQRSFNTSLSQADFSFSTYMRPYKATTVKCEESGLWNALLGSVAIGASNAVALDMSGSTGTPATVAYVPSTGILTFTNVAVGSSGATGYQPATGTLVVGEIVQISGHLLADHNAAIKILTLAAGGFTATWVTQPVAATVAAHTITPYVVTLADWADVKLVRTAWNEQGTAYAEATTVLSNKNQLVKFGMMMVVDTITYVIDNCCLNQADVNFGLDGIAMIAWTGMGTALRQLPTTATFVTTTPFAISIGAIGASGASGIGNYSYKTTTADFITNKLSTVTLKTGINGTGTAYNLALTGGQLTINNNVTYVTPANLGVVNQPVGYYTGTRAISGNVTAYLRTGTTNTAGLLNTLLNAAATTTGIEPQYQLILCVGGAAATTRVEFEIPMAFVQIPSIDAQAVLSTTINFTAEAYTNDATGIDIENTNELEIRYYHA